MYENFLSFITYSDVFFRYENLDDLFSVVCNDQYSLHHASICSLLLYIQQFTVRLCSDGAVVNLVTWRSKASNIIQSREKYYNMISYIWTPQNTKRSLLYCHHWYIYLWYSVIPDTWHFLDFHAYIHLLCT